ncbi:DUF3784 domain-containing protein [Runella sp.]|uniref:DUF3784 domain-containing protein n=1 Tax=Runella sp. TaxID=1960881 RepID=UPI003D0B38EE
MNDLWVIGGVGCLLIGLGLFIWKKQAIYLLSNFPHDPNQLTDLKGLARWAGIFLILMGLAAFITAGMAWWLSGTKYEWVFILFFILSIFLLTIIYLIGGQRFVKK